MKKIFFLFFAMMYRGTGGQSFNGVCYDYLGCYEQKEPWVSVLRPLPPPENPDKIKAGFYLLTRNRIMSQSINRYKITLNPDYTPNLLSLNYNDYRPERPLTVFIVHGYLANIESEWMVKLAEAYLSRSDANVFLLGWGSGADDANYLQVAANVRVVGDILARFLKGLIEKTYLFPFQVHMVCHSLGAHVCGSGAKQNPGIYRITALDPASLGFEGCPEEVRLNKGDAVYLDVLHTNGEPILPTFGLGYITPLGDVDFYFNGGRYQPECILPTLPDDTSKSNFLTLPVDVISVYLSCSHSKSIVYFTEAVGHPECVMWGHDQNPLETKLTIATLGTSQRLLDSEQCDLQKCSPVGLETFLFPGRGTFYVVTNLKPPHCKPEPENTVWMKYLLQEYYHQKPYQYT